MTEAELRNANHNVYTTQVKLDLLKKIGVYDTNPILLVQSLKLVRGGTAAQFLQKVGWKDHQGGCNHRCHATYQNFSSKEPAEIKRFHWNE